MKSNLPEPGIAEGKQSYRAGWNTCQLKASNQYVTVGYTFVHSPSSQLTDQHALLLWLSKWVLKLRNLSRISIYEERVRWSFEVRVVFRSRNDPLSY